MIMILCVCNRLFLLSLWLFDVSCEWCKINWLIKLLVIIIESIMDDIIIILVVVEKLFKNVNSVIKVLLVVIGSVNIKVL